MPEEYMEEILPPQTQEGQIPPDPTVIISADVGEDPMGEGPTVEATMIDRLNAFLAMNNIADSLDDQTLTQIGSRVVQEYEMDKESRAEWEEVHDEALELAKQVSKGREWAGEAQADIKYPTLATAAIQFAARAMPNIIKGRDVVKCKVVGNTRQVDIPEDYTPETAAELFQAQKQLSLNQQIADKEVRARRIEEYMSYQLLEEMEDWEETLDQLLISLPIVGVMFKKTYYDPIEGVNKSPLVSPKDLVVHYYARNFKDVTRVTHVFELTPNDIKERVNAGIFLDVEYGEPQHDEGEHSVDDPDAPHKFLEQHRWWDLDGDGYQEPYVVTVHEDSEQVVRITARYDADGIIADEDENILKIEPVNYFTRFLFMPAFDGNFYGMGFGSLLSPLNSTINTVINQLLDAGRLSNRQAGFLGKGVHLGRGEIRFRAGEWKSVNNTGDDLRKGIVPLPTREPSAVLFNLLSLMIEASKELSSVADVLTGEQRGANESPTTILSLIEQALKVFSVIYKRLHRSLKLEFRKIWRLNRLYLQDDKYRIVLDDPNATVQDFYQEDIDVVPVSDEIELTNVQRIAKAESLMQLMGTGLNDQEIQRRYLEAIQVSDIDKLMPSGEKPPPPEVMIEQQKLAIEQAKLELDQLKAQMDSQLNAAKVEKTKADAARSYADAKAKEQSLTMSPEVRVEMERIEVEKARLENERRKLDIDEMVAQEDVKKIRADAMKSIADAEAMEPGTQLDEYQKKLDELYEVVETQSKILKHLAEENGYNTGNASGVETSPGNQEGNRGTGNAEGSVDRITGTGSVPE